MKGFKHYGFKPGTELRAKSRSAVNETFPWDGQEVPIRIEKEYPCFITATVLPHFHRNGGLSTSRPYPVTLHKHDIMAGEILLNGGTIK